MAHRISLDGEFGNRQFTLKRPLNDEYFKSSGSAKKAYLKYSSLINLLLGG